jgi:hypothetical protein
MIWTHVPTSDDVLDISLSFSYWCETSLLCPIAFSGPNACLLFYFPPFPLPLQEDDEPRSILEEIGLIG